jgi:methyl-accepting chemotaxis protein
MQIRTKLVAVFLLTSLVPMSVVGVTATGGMQDISAQAQSESSAALDTQTRQQLNNTVAARSEEIQNLMAARAADARTLSESASVQNYFAARDGELSLVRQSSQKQVGYLSLQLRSGIHTATETILENQYNGQDFAELSSSQQQAVKDEVETRISGTTGDQTQTDGTMYETWQPGYISQTGYAYITDSDSNVVVHHSLDDGFNLVEDAGGTLTVFEDVEATVENNESIRSGETWGIAEYDWEDTTQPGNPTERKFIAYTYYEPFDWVIAPNVYYYELQATAVEDAQNSVDASFRGFLTTKTVSVSDSESPTYDDILVTDAAGTGLLRATRTANGSERHTDGSEYANTSWFQAAREASPDTVTYGDVQTTGDGHQYQYVSTPVYRNDTFQGVVALRFNYTTVTEITSKVTVDDEGYLFVADDNGRIVSHPDGSLLRDGFDITSGSYGGELATVATERMLQGQSGLATYNRTDNGTTAPWLAAYSPVTVGSGEYTLVATVPVADVNEPAAALASSLQSTTASTVGIMLLLAAAMAVGAVGAGVVLSRYFSRPIESVSDAARSLSRGKFDAELSETDREDEIGELVMSFRSLQDHLQIVAGQANALAKQEFDDPILDRDVPGQLGDALETMRADTEQFITDLEETQAEAETAQREAEQMAQALESQATEAAHVLEQAAAGDLTVRMDAESDTAAMERIAAEFNAMLDDLEATITEIQSFGEEVSQLSDRVSTGSREVAQASDEVAQSVEQISSMANDQSTDLQSVSDEMTDLSATVEEIASSTDEVAGLSEQAAEDAEDGARLATESIDIIDEIASQADDTVTEIEQLESEIQRIGDIVELIDEIAEQTNMLALNANIEAANADGSGEGFAVVADEVKSLAEETREATKEIEGLVEQTQSSTADTVSDVKSMHTAIQDGRQSIEESLTTIETIADRVEEVNTGVQSIDDATDQQAETTQGVVTTIDDIARASDDTRAESETVSAASEEQTATANEISTAATDLDDIVDRLNDRLDTFTVGDDDTSAADQAGTPGDAAADGGVDQ